MQVAVPLPQPGQHPHFGCPSPHEPLAPQSKSRGRGAGGSLQCSACGAAAPGGAAGALLSTLQAESCCWGRAVAVLAARCAPRAALGAGSQHQGASTLPAEREAGRQGCLHGSSSPCSAASLLQPGWEAGGEAATP